MELRVSILSKGSHVQKVDYAWRNFAPCEALKEEHTWPLNKWKPVMAVIMV